MLPDTRSVREKIRAAAVQLFAEMGYHAAPLRNIAELAGIQAASIYYHYPSKQALLVEMGCDFGQGFHLGRPQPAADFIARFASTVPPA